MEKNLYDQILGCLATVAVGDALGMPCHDLTIDQIRARFGGRVESFYPPFDDTRVHPNLVAGQITDDTILTLALARAYIENKGLITSSSIANVISEAYQQALVSGHGSMFGPSTRRAMEAVQAGEDPYQTGLAEKHPLSGSSNGAAMKIAPAGLVHPGDPQAAIQDAALISLVSHCTQTAVSSACALAAGVAQALSPEADVFSVVQAALEGARQGEAIGRDKGRVVPLPSVAERIKLAVSLALQARDLDAANRSLADLIGTGLAAHESIPTAIGIFVAARGDPRLCVIGGANVGFDTDTIAVMAGALGGALKGFDAVPPDLYKMVREVNKLELEDVARGLELIARRNLKG